MTMGSALAFTKKDNYTRCKNSALYSLGMREHSRLELFNKLQGKKISEGVDLDQLLDELTVNNYLCEQRFVESFIRVRTNRGQGRLKITSELQQKGLASSVINQAVEEAKINWYALASSQLERKFGELEAVDYQEKTRRMRFLSSRGFESYIIRDVIPLY